jgi:hypothetical protein
MCNVKNALFGNDLYDFRKIAKIVPIISLNEEKLQSNCPKIHWNCPQIWIAESPNCPQIWIAESPNVPRGFLKSRYEAWHIVLDLILIQVRFWWGSVGVFDKSCTNKLKKPCFAQN